MRSEHQKLLEKAMLQDRDIKTLELLHTNNEEDPNYDYDPYAFSEED